MGRAPLTPDKVDADGFVGLTLQDHIGTLFRHTGTNDIYQLVGVEWDAEVDRWRVRYRNLKDYRSVGFSRTAANFFGQRNGVDRFIEIT